MTSNTKMLNLEKELVLRSGVKCMFSTLGTDTRNLFVLSRQMKVKRTSSLNFTFFFTLPLLFCDVVDLTVC